MYYVIKYILHFRGIQKDTDKHYSKMGWRVTDWNI
jgi:hypothetical protein